LSYEAVKQNILAYFNLYSERKKMSSKSISYKVTIVKPFNQGTEVRRFLISQEICGNFSYLQGKLVAVFPKLKNNEFSIFWTDNEGDKITIASDEDLNIALAELDGPVYKITVKVKYEKIMQESQSTSSEEEETNESGESPTEEFQHWSGVFSDQTRAEPTSGQPYNNQGIIHLFIPPIFLTFLQSFGVNPNGFIQIPQNQEQQGKCPFETPTYHSPNCLCHQPNIIQYVVSQALKIAAMLTQASITISSAIVMLVVWSIIPVFILNSVLYLAVSACLGLPVVPILTGHILYLIIACGPPFLVTALGMLAVHRIFVLRRPLPDVDLELWKRKIERFMAQVQDWQA